MPLTPLSDAATHAAASYMGYTRRKYQIIGMRKCARESAEVVSDTKPVSQCANPYGVPFQSLPLSRSRLLIFRDRTAFISVGIP